MNSAGRGSAKEGSMSMKVRASTAPIAKGLGERSTFFGLCLIGKMVSLQTVDGTTYTGLFYCMKETESGDRHLVLTHATKDNQKDIQPYAIIPHSVFASLSAEEIDLAGQDIAAKPFHAPSRFEDSSITNDNGNVRALQAFVFDGADASGGLEEAKTTSANGWSGNDMFAENERRFGITATFEESMYTTAIDNANISAEEAQRIADSILSQRAATAHEREERGIIDDSGLSEEDKYGAVLRQVAAGSPKVGAIEGADDNGGLPSRPGWDGSSPSALPGPPRSGAAPGGGPPDASSERVEINAMRRKIAEGKSLKTAVPAELRTKYVNNASEVDALNLMPGSGSNKFRKDKVSNVAQSLDDFKTKRFSGSNPASVPSAAMVAAAANEGDMKPVPPDGSPDVGSPAVAATPFKMNPEAKPFSFNPKSKPFVPGVKTSSDTASTGTPEFGGHHVGGRGKAHRERAGPDGIRGARGGRSGRNNEGYGPQGGMYRPPAQGGYMYGGGPLNMVVPQGMHRGGPRHGGGMPQGVQAYPAPNGQMMFSPYPFAAMQGSQMVPAISMAPGPMMQPSVPGFPQSAAQSPPASDGYINKQG